MVITKRKRPYAKRDNSVTSVTMSVRLPLVLVRKLKPIARCQGVSVNKFAHSAIQRAVDESEINRPEGHN